jgi:hypothetical protein
MEEHKGEEDVNGDVPSSVKSGRRDSVVLNEAPIICIVS